ncbi:hypothetical protein [Hyphomicrobium sp.]|uniref:hypothetical protein n=1 Tax=Hyphomicrobium sp. TaxID=82 RepID=UPI003F6F2F27
MSPYDLVLVVIVGAGAFYAGYQVGRLKALSEREPGYRPDTTQPLPGPSLDRAPSEAGGSYADAGAAPGGRSVPSAPPRRSSKPPPAAAGLMNKD